MTKTDPLHKPPFTFLMASPQFWLCNIFGWLIFDLAQGVRNAFDGSPILDHLINVIPTSILGIIYGLGIHSIYKKRQWQRLHPVHLIPTAVCIAIVFGTVNVSFNLFDLVISIPEICSRQYPRPPYSCGVVSDLFLQSTGVMLIWCLFYFLIQAERKSPQKVSFDFIALTKALIFLLALNHLGLLLSVIAYVDWGDRYYLFSKGYVIDSAMSILPILFSSYVLFIQSEKQYGRSSILPLAPMLGVLAFCCTALSIDAGKILIRLLSLPSGANLYYILFGSSYGNINNASQLAGIIQGGVFFNLSLALFFLSAAYPFQKKIEPDHTPLKINFRKALPSWIYHFLFWLLFGLLLYSTDLMGWNDSGASIPLTNTISFALVGFFVGMGLRLQVIQFASKNTSNVTLAFKIVVASIFAGVSLSSSLWLINYAFILVTSDRSAIETYKDFVNIENLVFASLLSSCVLCGLWAFICYMIEALRLQENAAIKQLQLEKNMQEVQLNALAGRVDPHFIFNALNNIRALVDEDAEKARAAIATLSDILRSPITTNSKDKIPVADEMVLVRNYIALSKIQYEDRLTYQEAIDEGVNSALIPSMMLQILVENAIKHGISQLPDGGILLLQIQKNEHQLICTVTNHGSLRKHSGTNGFGVGIKAIRDRLTLIYGAQATFSLQEIDATVVAQLTIPLENTL